MYGRHSASFLSIVQRIKSGISITTPWDRCYYSPHFKDEETEVWRYVVTWLDPGLSPWVARDLVVGGPGPAGVQLRGPLPGDPSLLPGAWAFPLTTYKGVRRQLCLGTQVPLLQGWRFSTGALASWWKLLRNPLLYPQWGARLVPPETKDRNLLSALERDAVNICFKPKLVSNQSNC